MRGHAASPGNVVDDDACYPSRCVRQDLDDCGTADIVAPATAIGRADLLTDPRFPDPARLHAAALRAIGHTKDTSQPPGCEIVRDANGNPTGLQPFWSQRRNI